MVHYFEYSKIKTYKVLCKNGPKIQNQYEILPLQIQVHILPKTNDNVTKMMIDD